MSVLYSGQLTARIDGQEYRFNGEVWQGLVAVTVAHLNAATARIPKDRLTVLVLSEAITRCHGFAIDSITWRPGAWPGASVPDAVD